MLARSHRFHAPLTRGCTSQALFHSSPHNNNNNQQQTFMKHVEPLSHDIHKQKSIGTISDPKLAMVLHGILGSKRNWRTPMTKWIQQHPDYECVGVDLRGHGSSVQPQFTDNKIHPNTVDQCAKDLHDLVSNHLKKSSMDILFAHSFGGKVAQQYIKMLETNHLTVPKHTWILDSLPGLYQIDDNSGQSVGKVFRLLQQLPREFSSKEWMIDQIMANGIDKSVALWLATNIVTLPPSSTGQTKATWGFHLDTIVELFEDFCKKDMWEFLEQYHGNGTIHFLRAGKNNAWTSDILDRFHHITSSNPMIKLHTMPNVGHWLHVEDLDGMLKIITKESQ